MRIHPKYIQIFGDALIPLLGLLFWDWGLYFILLFYFIDLLVAEVLMHVKNKKIIQFQGRLNQASGLMWGGVSALLLLVSLGLIHLAVWLLLPSIDFAAEAIKFWTYTEMGIQQGYILIPLVVFAGYQQYRLFFLLPGKPRTMSVLDLWKKHVNAYYFILGGALLVGLLSFVVILPEWVYVIGIVAGTIAYRYFSDKES